MGRLCGSSREHPGAEDVMEGGAGSPQINVLVRLCYINVLRKNWSLNILCRKQIGRSAQFFTVAGRGEINGFPTRERAAVCCFGKPARTRHTGGVSASVKSGASGLVARWSFSLVCRELSEGRSHGVLSVNGHGPE